MFRGGRRAGGIIALDNILGPCPLTARIDGACPPGIDQNNAYDKLSTFYINPMNVSINFI